VSYVFKGKDRVGEVRGEGQDEGGSVWACFMCSRGRTRWGRWRTRKTRLDGLVLRVQGGGQGEGGSDTRRRIMTRQHVAVVSVRSSSWWATCHAEVWVFGGWRGAGIPADALRHVGMLLGWGCGRVVVLSSTCRDVVGLSKGGGRVVVVVFDASRLASGVVDSGMGLWKGGGVVIDVS
jgi:hypothetical protein